MEPENVEIIFETRAVSVEDASDVSTAERLEEADTETRAVNSVDSEVGGGNGIDIGTSESCGMGSKVSDTGISIIHPNNSSLCSFTRRRR